MSRATREASARQKPGGPSPFLRRGGDRQNAVDKEALSRLQTLDISGLRQQWRGLYKTQAPRHLGRELLV
jgi:hypothetical protein